MCDYCGCRRLTPLRVLMAEHDELRGLGDDVRRATAAGRKDEVRALTERLVAVLGPHTEAEEGDLFPALVAADEALTHHLATLLDDHVFLHAAFDAAMNGPTELLGDRVLVALPRLERHMDREDLGVFPVALATLDGDEWDRLADARTARASRAAAAP